MRTMVAMTVMVMMLTTTMMLMMMMHSPHQLALLDSPPVTYNALIECRGADYGD